MLPLLSRAGTAAKGALPWLQKGGSYALSGLTAVGGGAYLYDWLDQKTHGSRNDRMELASRSMQDKYTLEGMLDEDAILRDEQSLQKVLSKMGGSPEPLVDPISKGIDDYALQESLRAMAPELQASAERRLRTSSGITYMELLDRMGVT